MKLNAAIICDNLAQSVKVEYYGAAAAELTLNRPMFFDSSGREFKEDHLYIAPASRLPQSPILKRGVVIICVGGKPPISYLSGAATCIVINDNTDLFTALNLVQQIFNRYDEWDAGLQSIAETTASIQEMVDLSDPVFDHPIVVIDANFHYLGHSDSINTEEELALYRPDEHGNIPADLLSRSIYSDETNMALVKPFYIDGGGHRHLSINLVHNGNYAGNLSVHYPNPQKRDSDVMLVQHLARAIEKAFEKYSTIKSSRSNIFKSILFDLLNCYPIDEARRHHLEEDKLGGPFICTVMKLGYRTHTKVPAGYICNMIERRFRGSVAFEMESAIVCFLNLGRMHCGEEDLAGMINDVLQEINLHAGASHSFTDLSSARYFYRQACIAFDIGSSLDPEQIYYTFEDYALTYMALQCVGEFPLEFMLPDSIRRLQLHDQTSQASFIDTLRAYFNNGMNITKTTEAMFLHRSTFLERMKRIEKMLQGDMDDPDKRLMMQLMLKSIEISERFTAGNNTVDSLEFIDSHPKTPGAPANTARIIFP